MVLFEKFPDIPRRIEGCRAANPNIRHLFLVYHHTCFVPSERLDILVTRARGYIVRPQNCLDWKLQGCFWPLVSVAVIQGAQGKGFASRKRI